jgi:hypothetical protein
MTDENPPAQSLELENDPSQKEKSEANVDPNAQSLELQSDASQKEKTAATADSLDLPDPDAHLSEAERKAIVYSLNAEHFCFP